MMELFEDLGIDMDTSETSFSVSLDKEKGGEWGTRNGLTSLFVEKKNALSPQFWKMLHEIYKFKNDAHDYIKVYEDNADVRNTETVGDFIRMKGYSELFLNGYVVPICCSIWFCPPEQVLMFSAYRTLLYLHNHNLLQLLGHPQCHTVKGGSHLFVNKVRMKLDARDCLIKTNCRVDSIRTYDEGCKIFCNDGSYDVYDGCVVAVSAPDAIEILGKQATNAESKILGAFRYRYCDVFLHQDKLLMPQNPAVWGALNFLQNAKDDGSVTYWLNVLQNVDQSSPFFITLNPSHGPDTNFLRWSVGFPIPSCAASKASFEVEGIQGRRGIWFCGKYQGCGSPEDGLKAGVFAAQGILGRSCAFVKNPKQMVPSFGESAARFLVVRFLERFVSAGCIVLLEDGGSVLRFQGSQERCALKVALRVHSAHFYWKFATRADLGIADAYVDGDFSLYDKNEGLLNLFQIFIANSSSLTVHEKRGWWRPLLFTTSIASIRYVCRHISRQNTLAQARKNIARHYDLSNEMFGLLMGETMQYSCAIFKYAEEDLKDAQLRKISVLIKKAKIMENQELLEIGCGWGRFAIEVVKQTGCRYTGLSLSKEQLIFAEQRVKEAGLQDQIRFHLYDYRQIPRTKKYDRIVACEMIEHVGHEYYEEFFRCCESLLAENGLLILQFTSVPDSCFDVFRKSPGFIKEDIFHGGCLPSLSRITSAMATSSRLCVEQVENIGIHFYKTLRCWRKNFMEQQREILSLGFDEKFIRMWEYYIDYCAAGFKTRTLGNYQIVFSRHGNTVVFSNPFEGIPAAHSS